MVVVTTTIKHHKIVTSLITLRSGLISKAIRKEEIRVTITKIVTGIRTIITRVVTIKEIIITVIIIVTKTIRVTTGRKNRAGIMISL